MHETDKKKGKEEEREKRWRQECAPVKDAREEIVVDGMHRVHDPRPQQLQLVHVDDLSPRFQGHI